jgi:hypothetical protein
MLKYDTSKDGYVVPVTREQLEGAPKYAHDSVPNYDETYGRSVNHYYGVPWI